MTMNNINMLEMVGYLGSVLVIVSMLMTSVVRLRVINIIGSAIFTVYAILIKSYPTAFLNACLVIINIHQLRKLHQAPGRSYTMHRIKGEDGFVSWFVDKYLDDIKIYFPDFDPHMLAGSKGYAVFFEDQAAGMILGRNREDIYDITLDYTTPAFRDLSVGTFLYKLLPDHGITKISCDNCGPNHIKYMLDMGFENKGNNEYVKELETK